MRQSLIYLFGFDFTSRVMNSALPLLYPVVTYGDEWILTIYVLFECGLNRWKANILKWPNKKCN